MWSQFVQEPLDKRWPFNSPTPNHSRIVLTHIQLLKFFLPIQFYQCFYCVCLVTVKRAPNKDNEVKRFLWEQRNLSLRIVCIEYLNEYLKNMKWVAQDPGQIFMGSRPDLNLEPTGLPYPCFLTHIFSVKILPLKMLLPKFNHSTTSLDQDLGSIS